MSSLNLAVGVGVGSREEETGCKGVGLGRRFIL